jgi:tetratricopeptide (TPR) repeat protein
VLYNFNRKRLTVILKASFALALIIWVAMSLPAAMLTNLGSIELVNGRYRNALSILNIGCCQNGTPSSINWVLGQNYKQLNRLSMAEDAFKALLKDSNYRSRLSHFFLGQIYSLRGKEEEAIQEWQLAEAAEYFERVGNDSRFNNDWETAGHFYNLASRIDPNRKTVKSWFWYSQGIVALTQNDLGKAAEYFQNALHSDPENYDVFIGIGVSYQRLGQPAEAERAFLRALSLRENSFWPRYYLAKIDYQQGNCIEAIRRLIEANQIDSSYPNLHLWLARSYRKCGDTTNAMGEYETVLLLDPQNKEAQKELENLMP